MNSYQKLKLVWSVLIGLGLSCSVISMSVAQESKRFALKGSTELGGSISYMSTTSVSNGTAADHALNIIALQPFVGYFVADGFEISVNPLGIESISYNGNSTTQIMVFIAPSYNFKTEGITYPFLEALVGYTSQSNGSTNSGISWGLRGGVKLALTDKGLLNLGVQYLQVSMNPSGASTRSGYNQFLVSTGFSIWL